MVDNTFRDDVLELVAKFGCKRTFDTERNRRFYFSVIRGPFCVSQTTPPTERFVRRT
jgi:hypothetical protein